MSMKGASWRALSSQNVTCGPPMAVTAVGEDFFGGFCDFEGRFVSKCGGCDAHYVGLVLGDFVSELLVTDFLCLTVNNVNFKMILV